MSQPSVTVVVPTLAADPGLITCVRSLEAQTAQGVEVIVVDNSGSGRARSLLPEGSTAHVIENASNLGFGGAVNQGIDRSKATYVAILNDDAVAHPEWLTELIQAMESHPDAGMCASCVLLQDGGGLDSAGMCIAADASSTQRGHGQDPRLHASSGDALLPSGSAALYRRAMLAQTGGFDPDFFLYCEDTDLGLRAVWAGWRCLYVATARVDHGYSRSAGRASSLKAYYVERNRLWVAVKNFPLRMLLVAPFVTVARYFWHGVFLLQGRGKAAQFADSEPGGAVRLVWVVLRAHFATLRVLPTLLAKRRAVRASARLSAREFVRVLRRHSVEVRQVAAH